MHAGQNNLMPALQCPNMFPTRKQTAVDRGQTDRISLTHDLDFGI